MNEIYVKITPDDISLSDSCRKHGLETTHLADDIVKMYNDRVDDSSYCYPYDFNVILPTSGDLLYQPTGLSNLE